MPMQELSAVLQSLGLTAVQTYIQSGNAVFKTRRKNSGVLASQIKEAIGKSHGFKPEVLLLSKQDFCKAVAANPFVDVVDDPKTLHLFFMALPPTNPDMYFMESLKTGREDYALQDFVFYLHTPDGFARSKLAAKVGKGLGVAVTARNWRTVEKLTEMLGCTEIADS